MLMAMPKGGYRIFVSRRSQTTWNPSSILSGWSVRRRRRNSSTVILVTSNSSGNDSSHSRPLRSGESALQFLVRSLKKVVVVVVLVVHKVGQLQQSSYK